MIDLLQSRIWQRSTELLVAQGFTVEEDLEWLLVAREMPNRGYRWSELALLNGRLRGLAKIAWLPREGKLRACAEIPVDASLDVEAQLEDACAGIREACSKERAEPPGDRSDNLPVTIDFLQRLCQEAEWAAERRPEGLRVALGAGRGLYHVDVSPQAGGALVAATVAEGEELGPESREAMGLLLLTTSGAVRMARVALIGTTAPGWRACVQVQFGGVLDALSLCQALQAISTACDLCKTEAESMRDETIARAYLATMAPQRDIGGTTDQRDERGDDDHDQH